MISTATRLFNAGKEDLALRMLQQDMDLQLIAQVTDISIQQLHKLKK